MSDTTTLILLGAIGPTLFSVIIGAVTWSVKRNIQTQDEAAKASSQKLDESLRSITQKLDKLVDKTGEHATDVAVLQDKVERLYEDIGALRDRVAQLDRRHADGAA